MIRGVKSSSKGRPKVFSITAATLTRGGTGNLTATFTTNLAYHDLTTGDKVVISGADLPAYNSTKQKPVTVTVTNATVFTYTMLSDPGGSATVTNVIARRVLPGDDYDPLGVIHGASGAWLVERGGADGGRWGGQYIDNAAGAKTGQWSKVYALSTATITVLTGTISNIPASLTLTAGCELVGDFTAVTCTAGAVVAYHAKAT